MLTLGQQLYSLTLRDQTTSFVDPFLRRNNVTAGAGQALVNIDIPVPIDRSLYIHSIVFDLAKKPLPIGNHGVLISVGLEMSLRVFFTRRLPIRY